MRVTVLPGFRAALFLAPLTLTLSACAPPLPSFDPGSYGKQTVDPAKYPDADGVYLLVSARHYQTRAGLHDELREIYKVLKADDPKKSERKFSYFETQRAVIDIARTVLPDGTTLEVPRNAVRESKNADTGQKTMIVPFLGAAPGAVFDLAYSVHEDQPALRNAGDFISFDRWIPASRESPVLTFRAEVNYPWTIGSRLLAVNCQAAPSVREHLSNLGREVTGVIELHDLPGLGSERHAPQREDVACLPQVLATSYTDWDRVAYEVGQWFWEVQKTDAAFDAAASAALGSSTDRETLLRHAFAFVVQRLRWSESAPYSAYLKLPKPMPRVPLEILPSGFACPEEKSRLLYVLLTQAGIHAHPVLVRPGRSRLVRADMPMYLNMTEKLIVAVGDDPKTARYFDPGRPHSAFATLPQDVQGHTALFLTGRQTGVLVTLPEEGPETTEWDERQEIRPSQDGLAVTSHVVLSGEFASLHRKRLADKSEADWPTLFGGGDQKTQSVACENLDENDQPLKLVMQSSVSRRGGDDDRSYFTLPVVETPDFQDLPPNAVRGFPLQPGLRFRKHYAADIALPPGFSVKRLPADLSASDRYGDLSIRYVTGKKSVTYEVTFTQPLHEVSPNEYRAFVMHWKALAAALARPLELGRK